MGIRRSHNQDACATQPATDESLWEKLGHVFIVADGMGGHAVGEKASAKAVRDIPLTYLKYVATEGPHAAIERAFKEANAGIFQIGQNTPEFRGLGTTGSALFLRPEGAWVGHVGDSRVYRVRGTQIEQLTFDHSWVWEMARRRGVDPDELGDIRKNIIIRSLGPEADVQVDIEGPYPLEANDQFVICSDGLTNHVQPDEIGIVLALMPPGEACDMLVQLTNLRGGSDNVTALVVQHYSGTETITVQKTRSAAHLPKRIWRWWHKHVSWPNSCLLFGALFLTLSILFRLADFPGSIFLFVLAAGTMIPGIIGLSLHLRQAVEKGSNIHGAIEHELHLYKQHKFSLSRAWFDQISSELNQTKQKVIEANIEAAWSQFDEQMKIADAAAVRNDWSTAILARLRALRVIATPLNITLHKTEAFRPNWSTRTGQ